MNSIIGLYIFIIGLCIGSFLNVVILRGLAGESFILSRSKCPKCNNQLKWYMNIPLISYIFLKGKCAYCKGNLSLQYPIVDFITGLSFLGSFLAFGLTLKTLFVCIFISLFIVLATCDILETVIVEYHTYILFAIAVLFSFLNLGYVNWWISILSGVGGFLFFEILARFGIGAIFGFLNFVIVAIVAILIQCASAIPVLVIRAYKKKEMKLFYSYLIIIFASMFIIINNIFNFTQNIFVILLLSLCLLYGAFNIISSIRNKVPEDFDEAKEKFNIFPFGPALIISATFCIFALDKIKYIIKTICL